MHGAGTKAPVSGTEPPARLLDLTRLVSRVGHGPWTGVDRVERAYLSAVIADPVPAFGLVRHDLKRTVVTAVQVNPHEVVPQAVQ